ncbi:uncharacterized protein MELLADRAFT_58778 [Melampsora larici-populina 98AG31]|uniref:Uncharacterized protein n=1 Tax=Melampsora larici-populina (strain 98AG31 / pathotype 3-4-7) TaxID=747676 RepID=F4R4T7_MELLP|nr:uncharacterized protein MELLADRAFT_58778 [Melampsora larici-populina 98AG31]EGG12866.1 hypothetical protein MELLADRAFT_58778 [Melampsora larici-populina 98AG31]
MASYVVISKVLLPPQPPISPSILRLLTTQSELSPPQSVTHPRYPNIEFWHQYYFTFTTSSPNLTILTQSCYYPPRNFTTSHPSQRKPTPSHKNLIASFNLTKPSPHPSKLKQPQPLPLIHILITRPGLRGHPTGSADSPPPSLDSPPRVRATRGGHTGSRGGGRKRQRTDHERQAEDNHLPEPDDNILDESDDTLVDELGNPVTRPTLHNYRDLGFQISPAGLFEAQGLQRLYQLHKTMLCIVLKCSRHVLDEALLEGPLAREPNMYTNYQTYSVVATQTKTTSEAYALTQTPRGIPSIANSDDTNPDTTTPSAEHITKKSDLQPLSEEEMVQYVPIFKRLVNLGKVSRDLHEGCLWRHSGKSRSQSREQLMKLEINRVARQLHILTKQLNLQFHLLLACWNPSSPTANALFQDEHTLCERWARLEKKTHLLERFTYESTKIPVHQRPKPDKPKPMSEAGLRQAMKRTELTKALNNLITPFLRGGQQGLGDAHPKVGNVKDAFQKKIYRGNVQLTFHRTPDSLVNDVMISKGPSRLSNDEVQLWLDDIDSTRYTIIQVRKSNSDSTEQPPIHEPLDTTDEQPIQEETDHTSTSLELTL